MSAPVSIPRRGGTQRAATSALSSSSSSSSGMPLSAGSSYANSYSASTSSGGGGGSSMTPAVPSPLRSMAAAESLSALPPLAGHDDQRAGDVDGTHRNRSARRASLMSSSLAASEHTVINLNGPDEPPRLITCVRSSQGFDWNQEIFLPSHYDHLISQDLERRRDPVHDIVLTDEEACGILPQ